MTAALSKILPWLNQALPVGAAVKGLGKVNPKMSDFIYKSIGAGYGADQILDFIRNKLEPEGQQREEGRLRSKEAQGSLRPDEKISLDSRRDTDKLQSTVSAGAGLVAGALGVPGGTEETIDIISQESPDLYQFIKEQISQGRSIDEAGAIAQNSKEFSSIINRLKKKTNRNWSDILVEVFGGKEQPRAQQSSRQKEAQPQQQSSSADESLLQAMRDLQSVLGE